VLESHLAEAMLRRSDLSNATDNENTTDSDDIKYGLHRDLSYLYPTYFLELDYYLAVVQH
jgi:hypothetical protein